MYSESMTLLYTEFLTKFVWDLVTKTWSPTKTHFWFHGREFHRIFFSCEFHRWKIWEQVFHRIFQKKIGFALHLREFKRELGFTVRL